MAENIQRILIPPKVVKFLLSDILFASRNKREISVLQEIGCDVIVLCVGEKTEKITTKSGLLIYKIEKLRLSITQPRLIRAIKIIRKWISLARLLKTFQAECVSCHDLNALFIGWMSTWFTPKNKRHLLVYDSHEFEAGRNTGGKRSKLKLLFIIHLERFLMKKTAFNMMVNDSIAEEVLKLHHLKERPIVVKNVTSYWDIDKCVCKQRRKELLQKIHVAESTFLLMYHGGITSGRGIDNLLRAAALIENIAVVVLGYGDADYMIKLRSLIDELHIEKKVVFLTAVQHSELWQYVGAADAGIVTIENTCLSYYYSLPNKLFENIQAETPVIGSNLPEISRVINNYKIGLCCDSGNVDEMAFVINEMRNNKKLYSFFKQNLKKAKRELNWENEKEVLINAYNNILSH